MNSRNVKYLIVLLFIFLAGIQLFSEDQSKRTIADILNDIRNEQALNGTDKINPDKVDAKFLEELGDAVMIGSDAQHEYMDKMMGGEGSERLKLMHERIGYNYLAGNNSDTHDFKKNNFGMTHNRNFKGGYPMMWNNGYGMMGWGLGGLIMIILIVGIIVAVGLVIFFALRNKGGNTGVPEDDTPIDILKRRYARGEITKEEYESIKKDIQ